MDARLEYFTAIEIRKLKAELSKLREENDALSIEHAAMDQERSGERLARMKAENREQALAAHVEAIDHPATLFIESAQDAIELLEAAGEACNIVDLRQVLTEAADGLADALNNTPTTDLARLKAEWQAEALEWVRANPYVALNTRITELRRQAKGINL